MLGPDGPFFPGNLLDRNVSSLPDPTPNTKMGSLVVKADTGRICKDVTR